MAKEMALETYTAKKPMLVGELFEHGIEFSPRMTDGETIANVSWELDSALTSENTNFSDSIATVWVTATTKKEETKSICTITTNSTPPRIYKGLLVIYVDEVTVV